MFSLVSHFEDFFWSAYSVPDTVPDTQGFGGKEDSRVSRNLFSSRDSIF